MNTTLTQHSNYLMQVFALQFFNINRFIDFLFAGDKFAQIVGEEDDTVVNLTTKPYTVDELVVPEEFNDLVDETLEKIKRLSNRIDSKAYKGKIFFTAIFLSVAIVTSFLHL